MFEIKEVSDAEISFGAIKGLMPEYKSIPEEFTRRNPNHKWQKVFVDWFYLGLSNVKWTPKEGIDTKKAIRHIAAIMGSFEPSHEHKQAAVAFLLSEWFEDVTYITSKAQRGIR